ncbi:MAG: GNAT family N-acetyltransferase [Deltaproteobacteria bacterium]|nr:GNAT family N-acetyltransferase [Deltaproteobacteria bacterium]
MAKKDKPALMALLRGLPEFKPAEVVVAEEVIDSYLADPAGSGFNTLVAEADSVITGYISYGPTPLTEGTWDVYWMAVLVPEQGKGVGGALLAYAEDRIKEAGGRLIIIETSSQPGYEKTRRFYLNHGYETIAHLPDFYAPGDDKLILQKRLERLER